MDASLLFGAAFGFLLALLGWGDQIRGVQERTRAQEKDLLNAHKISWRVLRQIIRPSEGPQALDQLLAVLGLLKRGVLKSKDDVELLELFKQVDTLRSSLEKLYEVRYWILFFYTTLLFILGCLSTRLNGTLVGTYSWEQCYALMASLPLVPVIALTGYAAKREGKVRKGLREKGTDLFKLEETNKSVPFVCPLFLSRKKQVNTSPLF